MIHIMHVLCIGSHCVEKYCFPFTIFEMNKKTYFICLFIYLNMD